MRYITSVRIVNAFYQALAKVTKCSDYWNGREINTEMAWHKGIMTQFINVKYKGYWICDIRNDDGKFIIDKDSWRTVPLPKHLENININFKEFVKVFIEELKKEFEYDCQDYLRVMKRPYQG